MIQAVIVDFGGVLVDIPSRTGRLEQIAQELGVSIIRVQQAVYGKNRILWNRAKTGVISESEHLSKIGKSLHISPEKVNWIKKLLFEDVTMHEIFVEYLKSLQGQYQLAILSNALPCATAVWEKLGFLDWCDLAINSSEVGLAKPDPEIFHLTLQRLGMNPENCIFVDDQDNNIEAASALGFYCVRYVDAEQSIKAIQELLTEQSE